MQTAIKNHEQNYSPKKLLSQCATPDSRKLEEIAKTTRSPSCRSEITKNKKDAFCVNRKQKTATNLNIAAALKHKKNNL